MSEGFANDDPKLEKLRKIDSEIKQKIKEADEYGEMIEERSRQE